MPSSAGGAAWVERQQLSVRRADDKPFARRGFPVRIAEKSDYPKGHDQQDQAQPVGQQRPQDGGDHGKSNERPAFTMNRNSQTFGPG